MGVATFIGMLITGSVFSFGILSLFKKKIVLGVGLLLLSVACYITYVYIATKYFVE
ncbi:hypothetical protein D3C73_595930 [compost metagenome]